MLFQANYRNIAVFPVENSVIVKLTEKVKNVVPVEETARQASRKGITTVNIEKQLIMNFTVVSLQVKETWWRILGR